MKAIKVMRYAKASVLTLSFWLSIAIAPQTFAQTADPETGMFREGTVAMMCTAPTNKEVTDAMFEKALPRWIEVLQRLADDGVVRRAHYLSKLKDGIFIVIDGDGAQDALNKAVLASYELSQIFIDASGIQNFNSCTYTQLGSIAILPEAK